MASDPAAATVALPADRPGDPALAFDHVCFGYGAADVLHDLSFEVRPGEIVGLLGPNGSGKTTVLRLLSGARRPRRGTVLVEGRARPTYGRRALARRLAVVPQELRVTFDFSALDLVLMGRGPHLNWLRGATAPDYAIARHALAEVGGGSLAARAYRDLSGGEKQRVVLAMALAQEPRVLLLDEPTANLDLAGQPAVFDLVRRLNREQGLTVLSVSHDVNLLALYCDRLILLREGRVLADGPPEAVVTADNLRLGFGATVRVFPHPTTGRPQVALIPESAPPSADAFDQRGSGAPAGARAGRLRTE